MRGKRFVQASLKSDLQNVIAGQTAFSRTLMMTLVICLSILSGVFSGITGGFISLYTAFPQATEQRLIMLCATLVVLTSILKSVGQGFLQGFHGLVLASLAAVIISAVWLGKFDDAVIVGIALFSLLLWSTTFLSLLTGGLSVALLLILLDKPQRDRKSVV